MDTTVIIFAKLPVPGRVKTRLAADVGPQAASDFYKSCSERVIKEVCRCNKMETILYHSSRDEPSQISAWLKSFAPKNLHQCAQSSTGDLGDIMYKAMSLEMSKKGVSKVIILGTDIPDINCHILEQAANSLDEYEAVFGPARDGGYYLLGFKDHVNEALFQGISWSTSTVLKDSLVKASTVHLSVAPLDTLPTLIDVDTIEDLKCWASSEPDYEIDSCVSLQDLRMQALKLCEL
ncbi:hypothetical protein CEUSTIGMA_g10862.t1 [Chlamydomonas eustigma]|uniref:Glycosyltransferase n=1 Tax=Chlamydomonas eustigma TaxID=1157962 RepID=A0A250XK40_9CHLO|nr:hypothetical protein CEUSTIGMA_g10862.t1 [Chlamydomonas eustigma]|eukprot:GAX83437.1 hypothetical protein CEUSTIGMA_g10862.t1 [Chlamydomonas eustigma]